MAASTSENNGDLPHHFDTGASTSPSESPADTPSPSLDDSAPGLPSPLSRPPLSPHSVSTSSMTSSSTPLGSVTAARRPPGMQPTFSSSGGALPSDLQAKMNAFRSGRQGAPPTIRPGVDVNSSEPRIPAQPSPSSPKLGPGGVPQNFRLPPGLERPSPTSFNSSPTTTTRNKPSLAQKRGMALPPGGPTGIAGSQPPALGRKRPGLTLSQMNGGANGTPQPGPDSAAGKPTGGSMLDKYAEYIDAKTGNLSFKGKATLTNQGIEFAGGKTFSISLDEVDTQDELGKGNYGTVYKVRHARPRIRRPGAGLAGNKAPSPFTPISQSSAGYSLSPVSTASSTGSNSSGGGGSETSGAIMAMKEIRLELEDAKFHAIIMELDILHRCRSPYIVDFYGAFFQEGAVYICLEYMDGGSVDKLYAGGIPESVLRKITLATTMGLKCLKDDHNIIHRDVKPTNILVNTRGQVKICDFGVSGNLVASIAKTNIGCQSYMAPERISSGGMAQAGNTSVGTYSVQSDIWSMGLTIIECAMGQYPYPPETYENIFSQLSAIVDGDPPDLPADRFSEAARDFVRGCLMKIPKLRPTYAMLLQHAWLAPLLKPPTISEEDEEAAEHNGVAEVPAPSQGGAMDEGDAEVAQWVVQAKERKRTGSTAGSAKPALHTAPLDATSTAASPAAQKAGDGAGEQTGAEEAMAKLGVVESSAEG